MFVTILCVATLLVNVALAVYVGVAADKTRRLLRSLHRKSQKEQASGFERRLWDLQGQRFGRPMPQEPRKR